MAGRVYSERFILTAQQSTFVSYYVPGGKRAVIRAVSWSTSGATGDFLQVDVAGVPVLTVNSQANIRHYLFDTRWVVYAGQSIAAYQVGPALKYVSVNGFLFDDDGQRVSGDTPQQLPERPPPDQDWMFPPDARVVDLHG